MKLSISRKGFDSGSGGCPSPIFPDGTMFSLPIPQDDNASSIHYKDLRHGSINIGEVVAGLTRGLKTPTFAGLDPDINPLTYSHRKEGWRPLFGQRGLAQSHLSNQGVNTGDLFLFFGLYQRVEESPTGWSFVRDAPKQHVLWGWLQIGQVCKVDDIRDAPEFPWAQYHVHFGLDKPDPKNTLYIASEALDLDDGPIAAGTGVFPQFHERLVLTNPQGGVRDWRLPRWFYPDGNKPLTYHGNRTRWAHDDEHAYLQTVARGQEFVLDLAHYPEAMGWLSSLVRELGEKE